MQSARAGRFQKCANVRKINLAKQKSGGGAIFHPNDAARLCFARDNYIPFCKVPALFRDLGAGGGH